MPFVATPSRTADYTAEKSQLLIELHMRGACDAPLIGKEITTRD